jgi:hypothetical protein
MKLKMQNQKFKIQNSYSSRDAPFPSLTVCPLSKSAFKTEVLAEKYGITIEEILDREMFRSNFNLTGTTFEFLSTARYRYFTCFYFCNIA